MILQTISKYTYIHRGIRHPSNKKRKVFNNVLRERVGFYLTKQKRLVLCLNVVCVVLYEKVTYF